MRTLLVSSILVITNACRSNPFGDTAAPFERLEIHKDRNKFSTLAVDIATSARVKLDCAFSVEPPSSVMQAIESARKRKVTVRVILADPLRASQLRHNFCVADEARLFFFTASFSSEGPAIALEIQSTGGVVGEFTREINLLSEGLSGSAKPKTDYFTKYAVLEQPIKIWWGPQENPVNELQSAIQGGSSSLDIYSTGFEISLPKKLAIRASFSTAAIFSQTTRAFEIEQIRKVDTRDLGETNLIVVDREKPTARTFIYAAALNDSNSDSVLIELPGAWAANNIAPYLDSIFASATPTSNRGDAAYLGAVVISELAWMGSYLNDGTSDGADEFIEFHNNTSAPLNLSAWKVVCTSNAGLTSQVSFNFPGGVVIEAGRNLVVAAKNNAAWRADLYVPDLQISNSSTRCSLKNSFETMIDEIGDDVVAFDSQTNFGINDSTNRIRRSMERIDAQGSGTNLANWRSSTGSVGVSPAYSDRTYATPGAANSLGSTIAINNSSFEFLGSWTSLTAGVLLFDASVPAFEGTKSAHFDSLTSTISGREFQSDCVQAAGLTNYLAAVQERAPATNATAVYASLKFWWYSDANCAAPISQSTQPQSAAMPSTWRERVYSQTSPPATRALKLSIRSRYATQTECGGCSNASDTVYFDSVSLAAP